MQGSHFKSGPQPSSIDITRESLRNAKSQAPPQTYQNMDFDRISRRFKCPLNSEIYSPVGVILNVLLLGLSPLSQESKKQST